MAKETPKAKSAGTDKETPKAKSAGTDKEPAKTKSAGTDKEPAKTKSVPANTEFGGAEAASGSGGKTPVMFTAAVDMAHSRKYGFDGTGVCKVTAKIVAVPPPSAFLEWVQDALVGSKE